MDSKIDKVFIDWKHIEFLCDILTSKIKEVGVTYDSIVSIGRGGMIPARLISERLSIKKIHVLNMRSYTDINVSGDVILEPSFNPRILDHETVLIVDDVCTTGKSLVDAKLHILRNVDDIILSTATLYWNGECKDVQPDFFVEGYTASKTWLVFPWEFDSDRKTKQKKVSKNG